ncbi:MAG: DUF4199 domain-containing protein [Haliscomenobacteraceae bacterium CHB4]|nr:hypothetical protein [Saprospiraceae bacterium]MCE7925426.1 DUF4199 domain-containing protein [Haliscomenobacteraceae bacterium CHB4]
MKNPAVKYGLLGGATVVFYFAILYFIKKELFLNTWLYWASMAIYLLFMWRAAREDCEEKGVARDFREILRTPFIVFLLINLLFWLFWYTLHLADPELLQMENALQLNYLKQQLATGPGDPQHANQLRDQIQVLEKEGTTLTMGAVFLQMGIGALGGFLLSAGIGAIVRNMGRK